MSQEDLEFNALQEMDRQRELGRSHRDPDGWQADRHDITVVDDGKLPINRFGGAEPER
jgi:hypothetical protein